MPQDTRTDGSYADLGDLAARRDALRQAATMPGADPRALLDAAFAELDAAIEVLTKLAETDLGEAAPTGPADSLSVERALLRAVFQHAPAAVRARARRHGAARERQSRAADRRPARLRDRPGPDRLRRPAVPGGGQEPARRGGADGDGPAGGVQAARTGRPGRGHLDRGRHHLAGRRAAARGHRD